MFFQYYPVWKECKVVISKKYTEIILLSKLLSARDVIKSEQKNYNSLSTNALYFYPYLTQIVSNSVLSQNLIRSHFASNLFDSELIQWFILI